MKPERWEEVQRIFHEALARPVEERASYVAGVVGRDQELLDDVASLLAAHHEDPGFLESPLVSLDALDAGSDRGVVADRIGPYEVVRPLGSGGMGDVVLAIQREADFTRSVAIKVVKRGMDSDEIVRRFQRERRILAGLAHPNIAQLLDAGATDDGRPYFVMERVDGVRIDQFVRERELGLEARLELFRTVCEAVHHAHRNLVVHRDIKPGNVLVTDDGVVKLVDFGIGKVLDDADSGAESLTRTHARVLTPEYAAPEQLTGAPVTTAADVYALGVLLFELLVGTRPFEGEARVSEERVRAATGRSAPVPSAVAARREELGPVWWRRLRGDLDTIVARAMHAEPERRYVSATALAEDVTRFLTGQPVLARPDSFGYRAAKFVRRNGWAVAAAVAVTLGLVGVTGATAVQSARVARERDKAEEVRGFLLETFGASAAEGLAGDSITVRQLLDGQAATLSRSYADDPELEAEMLRVLAEAYERLGLYDDAEALGERALEAQRGLQTSAHADLASALNLLGWIRHQRGESSSAIALLEESVSMWRSLGRREHPGLARALNDLGVVLDQLGRFDEAEPPLVEALRIRRAVGGDQDRAVAITSSNMAAHFYRRGEYEAADSLGEMALEALRASLGPDHQRSIIAQSNLATFRLVGGDVGGAAELQADLLTRQVRAQGPRHPRTAFAMVTYATTLLSQGDAARAEELAREALSIQEDVVGPAHRDVYNTLRTLANALVAQGRAEDAITHLARALAVAGASYGLEHPEVGAVRYNLGVAYQEVGDLDGAASWLASATSVLERAVGPDHRRSTIARLRWAEVELLRERPGLADSLLAVTEASLARAGDDSFESHLTALRSRLIEGAP